jgi:excisionase family DNA binding protein
MNTQDIAAPDLLRVADIAMLLRISRSRTYALIKSGAIPSVRFGGTLRVPRRAYERWIASHDELALGAVQASGK